MLTATVPVQGGTVSELDDELTSDAQEEFARVAVQSRTLPCQVGDADLWFGDTPAQLDRAKTLCADCPVKASCLQSAIARAEPWGVWGGEIFERGTIIARKRPRGRPRKHFPASTTREEEVA